jgi:hypothetical protein
MRSGLYIKIGLAMALLLFSRSIFSQTYTQTIRGRVIDVDSKVSLPGASVIVTGLDTFLGGASDIDGRFRIVGVPVGRRTIKASFLGYEDVVLNNIVVSAGKEVILQIELRETMITAKEVEVVYERDKTKANNDLVTLSARNFQSEETDRYAGSRGDPSRMVANYAGVITGNDARNDIIVRGNSPLGVLWRLEGVDIPNPNHFSTQGATGGPVSMLNNNLLANSDFLTGAFPAEYGDKNAAVFDLKLRNGNNERMEFTGQMGINGFEAGIEGPISKKKGSSFLINYRYSTLEVFNALGIRFGVSGIPKYQDLCFKFNFPTIKAGIFSFWGLGGKSNIQLLDSQKDSTDWSFTQKGEDLVFGSTMGAAGFNHLYFFNSKVSGKLSLSLSGSQMLITVDTLAKNLDKFRTYNNTSIDGQYHINYTVTDKINARHLVKTGFTYSSLLFNYNDYFYSRNDKQIETRLNDKGQAGLIQSFVHWQYRIRENVTFNNGLHYQNFLLNNTQAIEPRSGIRWQITKKSAVSAAFGLHSQTQPLMYYFYKSFIPATQSYVETNKNIDLSRSQHYVLSFDHSFTKDLRFKMETYYQNLYNIPVEIYRHNSSSMLNVGNSLDGLPLIDSLGNTGTGKNYGVEFTIEKFFSKHYYFLSTLTLYQSTYKGSDGIEHNTAFNGGYVYNALAGIEIPLGKGNKVLEFDAKITFAGGNRYTPIDINASMIQKDAVYIESQAYSLRLKDYQRIDLKASFKINRKRTTQTFFVTAENILNRKNVLRQIYDSNKQQVLSEYQLGFFPYGGFRIEF